MTAVELRTSINEDLDTLGIETLEYVSKYVRRLALRARNRKKLLSAKPRKVKISSRIRSMSGRFSVPSDIDYRAKSCISTNGMAPGVYVLRLINGDDVKTQKIVIDK